MKCHCGISNKGVATDKLNLMPLPYRGGGMHRELLRAIVAVSLGISFYKVNLKALDAAYSIVFPKSTPLNVNKKKRTDGRKGTT